MDRFKMSCAVRPGRWVAALAALAVFAATGSPARAGNLDKALLENVQDVLGELAKRNCRAVGVLPFQVRKVGEQASYTSAPLAVNLPGRLENALVLATSPRNREPIAVLRDAAGVANRAKVGSWRRSASAFEALFRARYPVAWGNATARPDAFLTGLVSVAAGRKSARVTVQLFDAKSRRGGEVRMADVASFDVDMDRALLRDLGYGYALPRSALRKGVTARQRDAWAYEEDDSKPKEKAGTRLTPNDIAGMGFEIRYNGIKQTIRPLSPGSDSGTEWQVDPVTAGTKVTMVLTRVLKDDRMLGVVLKVNGRSTYNMQEDESLRCNRWLYGLDQLRKPDIVEGFYIGKELRRFRVLTAEESARKAEELGERAGWIDVDVYASGAGVTLEESDMEEITVTTRALSRSAAKRPATLQELREQLAKANNIRLPKAKTKPRSVAGLIVEEPEPAPAPPIIKGKLPNPVRLAGISIKYWDRTGDRRADD